MDVLFYSKTCRHCEALFRSGAINVALVKLVCVDGLGPGRLPKEVHSVPTLWDAKNRRLLVGPQVMSHYGSARAAGPPGASAEQAPADVVGFAASGLASGAYGDATGTTGDAAAYSTLQDAYMDRPPVTLQSKEGASSLNLEEYQARRDADIRGILSTQTKPV